ncbi:LacI family DNA-binding transcriptional regulator [Actomonas aquatica]|uniref:LacI family DNA-binding transcriptional regulator n=1 Tax=Actomonas aquatica TaxID=2866162 RepID=A0ABZ1C3L4_9BACT|nr:LacI family DNA-binding transcriptional regulator [Opitutus sp. WL0086]WRQ86308.1 LacI family DNA-binding transcriptional regulator [Opitutus sp. WL0086]
MDEAKVTLRSLARQLGLSPTTVSDALRGRGRVSAETAERVKAAAEACGFRINPLTSSVLAEVRRSRHDGLQGVIAAVDLQETEHWPHGPFPAELVKGARQRAHEMGFDVETFVAGGRDLPLRRLDGVLRARGIHGVMVLPSWYQPDVRELDWSRLAGIYTDFVTSQPALHVVCLDHYASIYRLLGRLKQRGYRRPGYIFEQQRSVRIQHRQRAAFAAFLAVNPEVESVPMAVTQAALKKEEFLSWFRAERPDVVLTHAAAVQDWIEEEGAAATTGFVLLNKIDQVRPCACLDQQPRVIGARALEMVAAQVLCGPFGPPVRPTRTLLEALWVEGPSVRPPEEAESDRTEAAAEWPSDEALSA